MKKKLLFVMNNLNCGGAEKALISLLNTLDYSNYEVDLLLFKQEGLFFSNIPKQVNLLIEPFEYKFFDMEIMSALKTCLKSRKFNIVLPRIKAGYIFKTEENRVRCEQRVWKYMKKTLSELSNEYDVAIGYLENSPIYFCIDKVKAKKKIGFIHNDYDKLGMDPKIDLKYFEKLDRIVTVSNECAMVLEQRFPQYNHKIEVMHNIVSPNIINKLSLEKGVLDKNSNILVSVGRLHHQKGFDMAIEACKCLVDWGYNIKWYVIGEGQDRASLEKRIKDYHLQNNFILLGIKENPYPFIKSANIYVQPSRFEGKSIAIDEAKIIKKPIVVTNFSTVNDQIQDRVNGIIVNMNAKSIAEGIKQLIENTELRLTLIDNLSKERLGTELEIHKLYKMFIAG